MTQSQSSSQEQAHSQSDSDSTDTNTNTGSNIAPAPTSDTEQSTSSQDQSASSGADETPQATSDTEPTAQADFQSQPELNASIDVGRFADTLNILSAVIEEAVFEFSDDGLRVQAQDKADVALTSIVLDPEGFESYTTTGLKIGVDVDRLSELVSMANAGTVLEIEYDPETNRLVTRFDDLEYNLGLINPDIVRDTMENVPELDSPATVVAESRQVNRGITAANMVADHVRMSVDESEQFFRIEATGDTDSVEFDLDDDDLISLTAAPADSLFSLEYLISLLNGVPSGEELTLRLGEQQPAKLSFEFADNAGTGRYLLAPRIEP